MIVCGPGEREKTEQICHTWWYHRSMSPTGQLPKNDFSLNTFGRFIDKLTMQCFISCCLDSVILMFLWKAMQEKETWSYIFSIYVFHLRHLPCSSEEKVGCSRRRHRCCCVCYFCPRRNTFRREISKTIFDFWLLLEKRGFQFLLGKVCESWAILGTLWAWCWH